MASNTKTFTVEILDTRKGSGMREAASEAQTLSDKLDKAGTSADGLASDMRRADRAADNYAGGLDRAGDAADTGEARIVGVKDTVDGVATVMQGPGEQGIAAYLQGWADLSSGIANAVVPALKGAKTLLVDNARQAVASGLQHARAAAMTALGWVKMGLQATINAAKMAAAWLISLGPIGLVIAAVAAVIAILVALGVGFDDITRWAKAAWGFILGAVQGVWTWIKENWPLLLAIITGPIGIAVLMIVRHWETIRNAFGAVMDWIGGKATGAKNWIVGVFNSIVSFITGMPSRITAAASGMFGGISSAFKSAINWIIEKWNNFSISWGGYDPPGPGRIPGFTINTPNIPLLAAGGVVPATPGGRLAVIGEGGHDEAVIPLTPQVMGQLGGGGTQVVIDLSGAVIASERQFEDMVVRAFRSAAGKGVPLTLKGRTL